MIKTILKVAKAALVITAYYAKKFNHKKGDSDENIIRNKHDDARSKLRNVTKSKNKHP